MFIRVFLQSIFATIIFKISLDHPVPAGHILSILGFLYYIFYTNMFKSFMNDYLIISRCLIEETAEYQKYECISKNKTYIEEYRKNQYNEFVFSSMRIA